MAGHLWKVPRLLQSPVDYLLGFVRSWLFLSKLLQCPIALGWDPPWLVWVALFCPAPISSRQVAVVRSGNQSCLTLPGRLSKIQLVILFFLQRIALCKWLLTLPIKPGLQPSSCPSKSVSHLLSYLTFSSRTQCPYRGPVLKYFCEARLTLCDSSFHYIGISALLSCCSIALLLQTNGSRRMDIPNQGYPP